VPDDDPIRCRFPLNYNAMKQEDNFDEEILRHFEPLKAKLQELEKEVVTLRDKLAALEKQELLRVRSTNLQFCRVCNMSQTHTGSPPMPPISDAERMFHEANHAIGFPANSSQRVSAFSATVSWDDVERQVTIVRKALGR
jgi:hypothetical protein